MMRMDCIDMASWAPAGLDPMFFVNVLALYLWSNVGLSPTALPVMLLYYYLNECFVIRVMSWIMVLGSVIFNLHKITVSTKWIKRTRFSSQIIYMHWSLKSLITKGWGKTGASDSCVTFFVSPSGPEWKNSTLHQKKTPRFT